MSAPEPDPNAASWVERHGRERPDALAVVDARHRLSYGAFAERVRRCAGVLAEDGVGPGERVAILAGNRSPYLETVLAATRLGAIAVPVNTRWSPREIAVLLDDCTPRAVVHGAELAEELAAAIARANHTPERMLATGGAPGHDAYELALEAVRSEAALAETTPEDPMILMYTSGTTGVPKGALLPHRKTLYNCKNAERFFTMSREDRVLVVVPLFHSFGLAILSLPTLHMGGTLFLRESFDPTAVWQAVEDEGITFFGAVPTMFQRLHDELERPDAPHRELRTVRFLFTAGSAMPVELIRRYEKRGLLMKQGFGQTETSILTCLEAGDALRKAGSVGRPVAHGEVRVVRRAGLGEPPETWQDVAPGETGEIVVRGPITMLGYWNRPEATAETIRGEWLRTSDLARVDEEGFLTLVGRARDMYISGGENVYPAEVEAVFEEHPAVREIAVVGEPDARWGEVGRAFIVPESGEAIDPSALTSWARERLAVFKIPKTFVAVHALPRTETGKVQKWRLRRQGESEADG